MLTITGLKNFYYLPSFYDMRCKAPRISEIIRSRYHRDPHNGDVYIFMSKDQRKVKMIHYERHAYYLHEKTIPNEAVQNEGGWWYELTVNENGVLCGLRSSKYNINPIVVKYGGGGHAKASGATIKDRETAMAMLNDLIELTK